MVLHRDDRTDGQEAAYSRRDRDEATAGGCADARVRTANLLITNQLPVTKSEQLLRGVGEIIHPPPSTQI